MSKTKPTETFMLKNGRGFASLTLEQITNLHNAGYGVRAFEWGAPYDLAMRFVNGFQMAALIARVPHDQAVNFNTLQQILTYFNNVEQPNLYEAVGGIALYVAGQTIINRTPAHLLTPFTMLQEQLAEMIHAPNHTPTAMPTTAPTVIPTALPTDLTDPYHGAAISGDIFSFFGNGCGGSHK